MSQANIALIQSLYAAFGRGDAAHIVSAAAPDCDWRVNGRRQDFPLFGRWTGQAGVADFFRMVSETEEFSEFSPRDFFAAEDRVFVLGHCTGKVKKTGRGFSGDWAHVFTVRDGKVAGFQEFSDTAQYAAAYKG